MLLRTFFSMDFFRFLLFAIIADVTFISTVSTHQVLELGTLQAVVGSSAQLQYVSNERRQIGFCSWNAVASSVDPRNAKFPLFKRNLTEEAEGRCGFKIDKITKEHSSVWKFTVSFKTSLVADKSDILISGHLRLEVVESSPRKNSVQIRNVSEVLTIVDSENPKYDNKSILPLICCSQPLLANRRKPQFFLDNVLITESRVKSDNLGCIKWSAKFDWRDDGKKVICTLNGIRDIPVDTKLQDSFTLSVLHGPKILPEGNVQNRKINVYYPTELELRVQFASNNSTALELNWYSVYETPEYERLLRLDPNEFPTELRVKDKYNEALLLLSKISAATIAKKKLIIRLRLSNEYDWQSVDFRIYFEKLNQAPTTATSWKKSTAEPSTRTDEFTLHESRTPQMTAEFITATTASILDPDPTLPTNMVKFTEGPVDDGFNNIVPSKKAIEIRNISEVLIIVDSENPKYDNKSIPPLICCSQKLIADNKEKLQFFLDNVLITESRVNSGKSLESDANLACIEWSAKFDWRDDGKKVLCTQNGISKSSLNIKLQDSFTLRVLYGPRILPYSNLKLRHVNVYYPAQLELVVQFASSNNTLLNLNWNVVYETTEYEILGHLDPDEFPTELRAKDTYKEAVLHLSNISATTIRNISAKKKLIIRLKLSNEYDFQRVDFLIDFEKSEQTSTTIASMKASTAEPRITFDESPFTLNEATTPQLVPVFITTAKTTLHPDPTRTNAMTKITEAPVHGLNTTDSWPISPYVIFAVAIIIVFGITSLYAFRNTPKRIQIQMCRKDRVFCSRISRHASSGSSEDKSKL